MEKKVKKEKRKIESKDKQTYVEKIFIYSGLATIFIYILTIIFIYIQD